MLTLTRQWESDVFDERYRVVLKDGERFGRMYQIRARFGGHHHPHKLGFRFEYDGLPVRNAIIRQMVREIFAEIDRSA